jgi:YD repeat-containing protein
VKAAADEPGDGIATCILEEHPTMASHFSRRGFLGGLLGAVAALRGRKAAAAPPAAPAGAAPPPRVLSYDNGPVHSVITYEFDAWGRCVSWTDPSGHTTTCTYDPGPGRGKEPLPEPPASGPDNGSPGGKS